MLSSKSAAVQDLSHYALSHHHMIGSSRELTKALLFLRTADAAVAYHKTQIESTKKHIQWNSVNGYYAEHMKYEEEKEAEERDLNMWEERLIEGQIGFADWAATHALGRRLPQEILDAIKEALKAPPYMYIEFG